MFYFISSTTGDCFLGVARVSREVSIYMQMYARHALSPQFGLSRDAQELPTS